MYKTQDLLMFSEASLEPSGIMEVATNGNYLDILKESLQKKLKVQLNLNQR